MKHIMGRNHAVNENFQLAHDPLEIPNGENVSVETTEYVDIGFDLKWRANMDVVLT